jgi:SMODS and SLOG-associating 2TM effector domain 1/SMODS and SLOG-associating 2TM effector domain 3
MPIQSHFPALYRSAGAASASGQNAFIYATVARLIALCAAGVFAEIEQPAAYWAVVATFAIALGIELFLLIRRPERKWYGGRAGAESAKTLAWRYSVGGNPFPAGADADALFSQRLTEVLKDLKDVDLLVVGDHVQQLTDEMKRTRELPLDERKSLYERERLLDQQTWYANKAKDNAQRATVWIVLLVVLEAGALIAALLRAFGIVHLDLFGLVGAVGASVAAWLQTKQHQNLAAAYSVAAQELGIIAAGIGAVQDEPAWAKFVADAEEAMSREHTMWRARRA